MEILLFLAVVIGVAIWLSARSKRAIANSRAQDAIERRMLDLMLEFPDADDQQIATLMRDELINQRTSDPAMHAWATPETAGRLRRTLVLAYTRTSRRLKANEDR